MSHFALSGFSVPDLEELSDSSFSARFNMDEEGEMKPSEEKIKI